jgi:hypothetical protein
MSGSNRAAAIAKASPIPGSASMMIFCGTEVSWKSGSWIFHRPGARWKHNLIVTCILWLHDGRVNCTIPLLVHYVIMW